MILTWFFFLILTTVISDLDLSEGGKVPSGVGIGRQLAKRDIPTIQDRPGCQPSAPIPINRVETTLRLTKLREMMSSAKMVRGVPIKAYLVTSDDEHQSEYVSRHDERRHYISGFSGSSGIAVITTQMAALWTDGRYYVQAEQELDCNWILMKSGLDNVPTIPEWLKSVLNAGDRIGADPKLVSADVWLEWRNELVESGIHLDTIQSNLVDAIWNETNGRPKPINQIVSIHDIIYAGRTWEEKVASVRNELTDLGVDSIIITGLDETTWLLNLRGRDIPYHPYFKNYVFLSHNQTILYISESKVTNHIRKHLKSDRCHEDMCVEIRRYDHLFSDLPRLTSTVNSVLLPSKYAYSGGASFAIYEAVPIDKRRAAPSPLIFLKAQKNDIEVQGMKNAHIRDAVALCDFISLLQEEVSASAQWDEMKASKILEEYRSQQNLSRGSSFETIVAFGSNGAVIHYKPNPMTNRKIDNSSLLLLDSGGQYLDGTTDVTRTFHFGTPTPQQKELYTRVLMGAIDLAMLVFPENTDDTKIDIVARQHLYQAGLDYRHGTGHGIGAFNGVHEGPVQIRIYGKYGHHFEENYFLSDEPGYYKENEFGIRLETILRVIRKNFQGVEEKFYGFEPVTLVPFEPKLILPQLMTHKQIQWLNQYNALVRTKVGSELKRQNRMRGFYWLMSKTGHVSEICSRNGSPIVYPFIGLTVIFSLTKFLF